MNRPSSSLMRVILAAPTLLLGGLACGDSSEATAPWAPALTLTPAEVLLDALEDTARIVARVDEKGTSVEVTWGTTDPGVATVDATGLVTAVSNGSASIWALSTEGAADTASVTVDQVAVRVEVSPHGAPLSGLGASVALSATGWDKNGFEVEDAVITWRSLSPARVSVSGEGVAAAAGDGQTAVGARIDDAEGYSVVTVAVPGTGPARTWELAAPLPHRISGISALGTGEVWAVGAAPPGGYLSAGVTRLAGAAWVPAAPDAPRHQELTAVWGSEGTDVWAVGRAVRDGIIAPVIHRWDGAAWAEQTPQAVLELPGANNLQAVWGDGSGGVWAGGVGVLARFDGSAWVAEQAYDVRAIWGSGTDDVWAVGAGFRIGAVHHFDGSELRLDTLGTTPLTGVGGTGPDDVWAVSSSGGIWHYDGTDWSVSIQEAPGTNPEFRGVWAAGPSEVWAVGQRQQSPVIWHYDGSSWTEVVDLPASEVTLWSVAGTGPQDVWAGGDGGTLLHYDGGTWRAVETGSIDAGLAAVWAEPGEAPWAMGRYSNRSGAPGAATRFDGERWTDATSSISTGLSPVSDLWGIGPEHAWSVGGQVLRFDGAAWAQLPVSPSAIVPFLWAGTPHDVWVFGSNAGATRYDGTTWEPMGFPPGMNDAWGAAPDDIWAVGNQGKILHWDGVEWAERAPGVTTARLLGVWGSGPSDVWAVGEGVILHFDGASWTAQADLPAPEPLNAVWGTGPADVYAVGGYDGTGAQIWHYDGVAWSDVTPPHARTALLSVFGSRSGDVWATGRGGLILRGR